MAQVKFVWGRNDEVTRLKLQSMGGTRADIFLLPDGTLAFLKNDPKEGFEILSQEGFGNFNLKTEEKKEEDLCDKIIREWREERFI